MLHIDVPTREEFLDLNAVRGDACISIYMPTTPLTQDVQVERIQFGNHAKEALAQLHARGFDKRRMALIEDLTDHLREDDEFWRFQANSLAVLVTPDRILTYRLANRITPRVEVSDRFHLSPLLRSMTVPQSAYVLALSENDVRLVQVFADLPAQRVHVHDLPRDAASALGKSTLNERSASRRITGAEGQKVRLTQFARRVDAALRPVLRRSAMPLILAATEPLASIFRGVNSYAHLMPETIRSSDDDSTEAALAAAARPVLDAAFARDLAALRDLYDQRASEGRATSLPGDVARAAGFGAIDVLMVDMDVATPGRIDDVSGAVTYADAAGADSYGIEDEIMRRALAHGARILSLRKADMPAGATIAAILRYAV